MAWAPDYVTTAELRAFLRILDDVDDAQLALAIAAASRAVDQATRRQFGVLSVAAARYYTVRQDDRRDAYVIDCDDLMSTSGFAAAADTEGDGTFSTSVTDYTLLPRNAAADGEPWTQIVFGTASEVATTVDSIRVTALWGWTSVPDTVKQATLLQATRVLKRRDAPFGVAGSPDSGTEMRLLAKVDPDVAVLLRPYRRQLWAGAMFA